MTSNRKRKGDSSFLSPPVNKVKAFKDNHAPRALTYRIGDDDSNSDDDFVTPESKSKRPRVPPEVRMEILQKYLPWKADGGRKSGKPSPVKDLLEKYNVGKNYLADLLKKFLHDKSLADIRPKGRPKVFGSPTKTDILKVAEKRAQEQKTCPARDICAALKKVKSAAHPSKSTIWRLKRAMKFTVRKVEMKPELNTNMMQERYDFAKRYLKFKGWKRTVVIDEKWFTEQKNSTKRIELPKGHISKTPLKCFGPKSKDGGPAQLTKVMYLAAISCKGKIGNYQLKFEERTRETKSGNVVKAGVDSKFLLPFWKKIAAASRKTLGLKEGDEMFLQMDRASCHFSKLTQEELKKVGFTVIKQPPRSPDFNMLDAFLFPTLERECEKKGAVAREEIVAAVRSVWAKVTAEECKKAHKRILRNMERAIDLKGGNFYHEGR